MKPGMITFLSLILGILGLASHFSGATPPDDAFSDHELSEFKKLIRCGRDMKSIDLKPLEPLETGFYEIKIMQKRIEENSGFIMIKDDRQTSKGTVPVLYFFDSSDGEIYQLESYSEKQNFKKGQSYVFNFGMGKKTTAFYVTEGVFVKRNGQSPPNALQQALSFLKLVKLGPDRQARTALQKFAVKALLDAGKEISSFSKLSPEKDQKKNKMRGEILFDIDQTLHFCGRTNDKTTKEAAEYVRTVLEKTFPWLVPAKLPSSTIPAPEGASAVAPPAEEKPEPSKE